MMFFLDLFIIICGGVLIHFLFNKIKVPALIGYLLLGILINAVGFIDPNIEAISPYIRKIALVIILIKAGLSLDVSDLKKVGRPAILMSFLPAVVEMCVVGAVAPLLFDITYTESFILGAVLGAVSPAVVIPMMTKLMEKKRGTSKGIPQLILAGSSIDDIVMMYRESAPSEDVDMSDFMKFELIKDKICFKLCNTDKNCEILENIPSIPFHDLSIIFYVLVSNELFGSGQILIRNEHLKLWNVKVSDLMACAKTNTPQLLNIKLSNIIDVMKNILRRNDGLSEKEISDFSLADRDECFMWVLSNEDGLNYLLTL